MERTTSRAPFPPPERSCTVPRDLSTEFSTQLAVPRSLTRPDAFISDNRETDPSGRLKNQELKGFRSIFGGEAGDSTVRRESFSAARLSFNESPGLAIREC